MTTRIITNSYHAASYAKFRPKLPTKVIERIVGFMSEKLPGPYKLAVDVGCGNGQSTSGLAPFFSRVVGQDSSSEQIDEARLHETSPNVSYVARPAETLPYNPSSAQLVLACQAAHWFNLPAFYRQVDTILQPSGVLALCGYRLPVPKHSDKSEKLKNLVHKFYFSELVDYVQEGSRETYLHNYSNIRANFPYEQVYICNDASFVQQVPATVSELVGYIGTWSGLSVYRRKHGERADQLLSEFTQRVMDTTDAPSSDPAHTQLTLQFQYFLLMGRKINKH